MDPNPRNSAQDLIKWLAMITMVIDHTRYLFPAAEWLFIPGRFAFPFFALAMAMNTARAPVDSVITDGNSRYLLWLMVFTMLSEVPYRWLSWSSGTASIMPTLMLGLLVAWGIHYRSYPTRILALGVVVLAAVLNTRLMYGVYGVLLPAAFLLAIKRKFLWAILPALVCVAANRGNVWMTRGDSGAFVQAISIAAFTAPLLGLALARRRLPYRVWPVGRWGYWFYPGHLAVIKLLKLW